MIDLGIKSCRYKDNVFYVKIKDFEKLTTAPIVVLNKKTKKEKKFIFSSKNEFNKIFKCDN